MYVAISRYFGNFRKRSSCSGNDGTLYVLQTPSVNNDKKLQKRKATFSVTKEVKDRTVLSNELASFCAKYPIFRLHVVPDTTVTNIMITKTAEKSESKSR